jgi:putative DNA primase/helicase
MEITPTIQPIQDAVEALYKTLRDQQARAKMRAESSVNGAGPSPNADDARILEKARAATNGEKFRRLWAGALDGYPSQSEADLALCRLLAFFTQDAEQIDRLFRQSGLMREKWERADYRDGTMTTAIESAHEHWRGVSASHDSAGRDERHTPQWCDDTDLILLPLRPSPAYRGPRPGVRHG